MFICSHNNRQTSQKSRINCLFGLNGNICTRTWLKAYIHISYFFICLLFSFIEENKIETNFIETKN
jgi:hypothetical protein